MGRLWLAVFVLSESVLGLQLFPSTSTEKAVFGQVFTITCQYDLAAGENIYFLKLTRQRSGGAFEDVALYQENQDTTYLDVSLRDRTTALLETVTDSSKRASMRFNTTICSDRGTYRWTASYFTGTTVDEMSMTTIVTITAVPTLIENIELSFTPSASLKEDDDVTFTCTGDVGAEPLGEYRWHYFSSTTGGVDVTSQAAMETPVFNDTSCSYSQTSSLVLKMLKEFNGIVVRCTVLQLQVEKYRQTNEIEVQYGPVALSVLREPTGPFYYTGDASLNLTCSADANPPANYYWVTTSGNMTNVTDGAMYHFTDLMEEDTGDYVCVAYNTINLVNYTVNYTANIEVSCASMVISQSCDCPSGWENAGHGYRHISYDVLPDDVNVPNPGRGFFKQIPARTSHFGYLNSHVIATDRTVIQRMYYMDTYINRSLDEVFIRHVKNDLNFVRQQGWTAILRFSYTPKTTGTHDAGVQRSLEHIEYLGNSSLFTEFEGVIATIQAGFIGVWGEWYEATNDYGKPKQCSSDRMFGLTTSQWSAREAVLRALMKAVPASIQIELRYPWLKYKMFGDAPTTLQDVQNRTDRGRIGFHNDAFLSTSSNMGTYKCGQDQTYLANESRYTVVSGETNDNRSVPTYACNNAMAEMAKYHWSMLNEGFQQQVTGYWTTHGCHDEIAAKLGYRLYLLNATLPQSAHSSGSVCFQLYVGNNGYAAPYKEMNLHIVLKNIKDESMYSTTIQGYDVRAWLPGHSYTIKGQLGVPSDLHGSFKVYLALTDKIMQYNEKYFTMMANRGMDTTTLRLNDLMHTISITKGTCNSHSNNQLAMWKGPVDGCRSMHISDGSFEDDALGWRTEAKGYNVVTSTDALVGNKYITVTNGGAWQAFDFSRSPINKFTLSGYSRSHSDTSIHSLQKYSIKCNIGHTDGSRTWNVHTNFDQNQRNVWMFRKLHVQTVKPIATAQCYALFETGSGSVDFDNFVLNTCIDESCEYNFTDGSFEDMATWKSLAQGYQLKTGQTDAYDGDSYITMSNNSVYQTVNFTGSAVTEFTVSGYSRAHGVAVSSPMDYSISCDLQYADGSSSDAKSGLFDPTVPDTVWQQAVLHVTSTKVIAHATCRVMLKDAKGHADFDNFQLTSCL